MLNNSNNIKASIIIDDFQQLKAIPDSKCMTILQYDYTLNKSRKQNGEPHAAACAGSIMTFTLAVGSANKIDVFYSRIKEFATSSFSILFDVLFDENRNVSNYSNALVVNGYVVDVKETYDVDTPVDGNENILLQVSLLVNGLKYIGIDKDVSYNY